MIKTAGTTLSYILRSNYSYNFVEVGKTPFRSNNLRKLLQLNPRITALQGHGLRPNENLRLVCPQVKFITFMRDPVARFLSHCEYGVRRGHHQDSWDERCRLLSEQDYQTKFLLGCLSAEDRNFVAGISELEMAKKALTEEYDFVGVVECFTQSLFLMKNTLTLTDFDVRYEKKNITCALSVPGAEFNHEQREIVEGPNRIDRELYTFVVSQLLEAQKNRYDGNLKQDVNHFVDVNEQFTFSTSKLVGFRLAKHLYYRPFFELFR